MRDVPHFNDPEHWQLRAEESRVMAEQMNVETAKQIMLRIADDYEGITCQACAGVHFVNQKGKVLGGDDDFTSGLP